MMKVAILEGHRKDYRKALQTKFPEVVIRAGRDETELGSFAAEMDILLTFRASDELRRFLKGEKKSLINLVTR